ncbi:hypothetical protein [Mycobacterium sp. E3198]|uniref:hypothetical protein n=1 Tax=Mycobacterium sp. E3198 TaxID=1834143 RepID=UPI0008011A8E|nr:hypothetical protein [Mycobacterium sp. E3198]OBG28054.1 hypothetical protein A5673_05540 [Mycobacterium sp. E3198]
MGWDEVSLIFILIIAVIVAAVAYQIHSAKANAADEVSADWSGLRMTRTELINGYKPNAHTILSRG